MNLKRFFMQIYFFTFEHPSQTNSTFTPKNAPYTRVVLVKDSDNNNIVLVYAITGSTNQIATISQNATDAASDFQLTSFPGLRSLPKGTRTINFKLKNDSSEHLSVYKIKSNDTSEFEWFFLSSGEINLINMHFGQAYSLTVQDQQVRGIFVSTAANNKELRITNEMINAWK